MKLPNTFDTKHVFLIACFLTLFSLAILFESYIFAATIFAACTLFIAIYIWKYRHKEEASNGTAFNFIAEYEFPKTIHRALEKKYPYIDHEKSEKVFDGLRQYFQIILSHPNTFIAMPSKAVDFVWHEFILDTRAYTDFCMRAAGRYIHHIPTAGHSNEDIQGSRLAWITACHIERINPLNPHRKPVLFTVDDLLSIENPVFEKHIQSVIQANADSQKNASSTSDAIMFFGIIALTSTDGHDSNIVPGSHSVSHSNSNSSDTSSDSSGSSCGGGCGS